ncbi:MAG: AgmX/PglI C-terminal domain-containing protein, partial [Myxococcota bacterium]
VPGEDAPLDSPGGPILLGSLDKGLIDGVIKAGMGEVRACYTALQRRVPDAAGTTTMKFVVAANGTVSSTAVKSSTIADVPFQDCLRKVFHGLRYPEPKGGGIVIVSYPLVFSPG